MHLQRIWGAPGPVERLHQQYLRFLAQWVVDGEGLERRKGLRVSPGGKQRFEPAFRRTEIGLGEGRDGALRRLVVCDLGKGVAGPRLDCCLERLQRLFGAVVPQVLVSLLGEVGAT